MFHVKLLRKGLTILRKLHKIEVDDNLMFSILFERMRIAGVNALYPSVGDLLEFVCGNTSVLMEITQIFKNVPGIQMAEGLSLVQFDCWNRKD